MTAAERAPPGGGSGGSLRGTLVLGGNGFIGRHLCRVLLEAGEQVTVIDNLSGSLEADIVPGVTFIKGTTSDASLMDATVPGFAKVYHLAATTGHIMVSREPKRVYDEIVAGAENLARSVTKQQKVWAFSSSAALGTGVITNAPESHQLFGVSYDGYRLGYGAGKARLEEICAAANKDISIVRPFNVVGPGQTGRYGMVLPTFVGRGLLKLPIMIYDEGEAIRTYGDVETFVDCLLKLDGSQTIINIGSEQSLSVNALVAHIEAELNYHFETQRSAYYTKFQKEDVFMRTPDISLLRSAIGHVEWKDIRQIVKEVADWMRPMDETTLLYHVNIHASL